jgi:formyltetrahydrofolate deformylase
MFNERVITLSGWCPDRSGIVAEIAQIIAEEGGWILETSHHSDVPSLRYFMRFEIRADSLQRGVAHFTKKFGEVAKKINMVWRLSDSAQKRRMVVLVSKEEHCLYDILSRYHAKEWNVDIPLIISNHEIFADLATWHGIPFHYFPMRNDEERNTAYQQMAQWFVREKINLLVLARFMQIIPAWLCEQFPRQIINIHHSFLPSFVGAKPYHQAFEKGVKLIGATCHYVTSELDQGPIIEQDVIRINHSETVDDLVRYGKDIEKIVLARGLRYHLEDRVLDNGVKTVVFS